MKKTILYITHLLLLMIFVFAFILDRQIWAVDAVILGSLLTAIYFIRSRLNLTDFLFLLLAILVLMHCFALFGLFKISILGYEYDTYVHLFSSIVIALVAFNYIKKFNVSPIETALLALLLTLGIGLCNELVEFAGYLLFGRGEGLFLLGSGDLGATDAFENLMTDFFNDFYGNLIGIIISLVYHLKKQSLPE